AMETSMATATDDSDAMIIQMCQSNPSRGFELLHDKYGGYVLNLLRRRLRDEHHAEDAKQEVFINIMRHMETFRGESKLQTWLTRIVFNTAHTLDKKRKRASNIDAERLTERRLPIDSRETEIVRGESASETHAKLQAALAKLPEELRRLVMLDVDKSYEEISAMLGLSLNQVRGGL